MLIPSNANARLFLYWAMLWQSKILRWLEETKTCRALPNLKLLFYVSILKRKLSFGRLGWCLAFKIDSELWKIPFLSPCVYLRNIKISFKYVDFFKSVTDYWYHLFVSLNGLLPYRRKVVIPSLGILPHVLWTEKIFLPPRPIQS